MILIHKTPKNKNNKILKLILLCLGAVVFLYLVTIPWRSYVYRQNIREGDDLLLGRKYTEALVHFQKAGFLEPSDKTSGERAELVQNSAKDIFALRDFLRDKNQVELLKLIDDANSKTCNLETDRTLIEKDLSQVAKINLEFCANNGPKNYDSWLFLGIANQKISENNYIFKELKPGHRQAAADAYAKAYAIDPINKTAIEYSISVNKIIGNQAEVDRWQKLLDNLNKISR